jgi:hypothetical protein
MLAAAFDDAPRGADPSIARRDAHPPPSRFSRCRNDARPDHTPRHHPHIVVFPFCDHRAEAARK